MFDYFTPDYAGEPFRLFGTPHLVTLVVVAAFGFALIRLAQKSDHRRQRKIRRSLVVLLLMNELSWHIWNLAFSTWAIQKMLPLHLCSAMIWITIVVLLLEKRAFYPLVYFLGVAGAVQALITPDAGIFGYPHFRFFQTTIAHGGLVIAGLWVVLVEDCRPDFKSLVVVLVGLNIYAFAVWLMNTGIGSNYLYVVAKPETASVLDYFPAWPWYIAILELLAILFLGLLYLPFRQPQEKPANVGAAAQ